MRKLSEQVDGFGLPLTEMPRVSPDLSNPGATAIQVFADLDRSKLTYRGAREFEGQTVYEFKGRKQDWNDYMPVDVTEGSFLYVITDGGKDGRILSGVVVTRDEDDEGRESYRLAYAWTDEEYARQGLSRLLHRYVIRRYRELRSDRSLTRASHNLWKGLGKDGDVQVKLGASGPGKASWDTQHLARWGKKR